MDFSLAKSSQSIKVYITYVLLRLGSSHLLKWFINLFFITLTNRFLFPTALRDDILATITFGGLRALYSDYFLLHKVSKVVDIFRAQVI